jgi:hypothetical protein
METTVAVLTDRNGEVVRVMEVDRRQDEIRVPVMPNVTEWLSKGNENPSKAAAPEIKVRRFGRFVEADDVAPCNHRGPVTVAWFLELADD